MKRALISVAAAGIAFVVVLVALAPYATVAALREADRA